MNAAGLFEGLLSGARSLLRRLGVRGRLLLAFFGISAFAVIAAAAAMYSFAEVGKVLGRITQERMPSALASLELSRQAERIVTAAPAFLAATTRTQHQEVSRGIAEEVERLDELLEQLKGSVIDPGALAAVEPAIDGLERNLAGLNALVASRLQVAERKEQLLRRLSGTNIATQRLVAPGVLVMDSKLAEYRRAAGTTGLDEEARAAAASQLAAEIAAFMPQQKAQIELSAINDSLTMAADAEGTADLPLLAFPLRRSLATLETLASEFDDKLRTRLVERVNDFRGFMEGPESILAVREEELSIIAKAEALLAENVVLSRHVGDALDRLVGTASRDIGLANQEALAAQRLGSRVLIGMVLLSLISSGLIVWLYVDRNLIARLTALSDSMLAIAGGNLRAPLPSIGHDEIGRMADALTVFRDTAVEVEENKLREIAQARQRLIDAIESISEGFAFYDAEDRLQLCNTRYQELLYGSTDISIAPGIPFETMLRRAIGAGLIVEAVEDPESYVRNRLAQHRSPGPPRLQRRADGRWILIAERKVTGGGTVAVYSDITELKQRETELEEANRRTKEAAEEIGHKHRELQTLSSKLAKYLSPQVYASIFAGRQEVKLASQRKKLTVFFSDIAGFTETTDKMESEDVTQLLNQYLTEMSRIALEYGATIDKYVGDAIMIFFGDPETRGVKEDALACVRMAIAMRERMRALGAIWRDSGIETPISCRIGIHTGYCTVGNFGSEDRMDYTIVGGAVNLASRLEHEAPTGGILISYETYAQVKDEIRCEEMGRIQVRGIGHPVATYRVLDLRAGSAERSAVIRSGLPHLKLDVEPELMSADERRQAAALLQEALQRLGPTPVEPQPRNAGARTEPAPPPKAGRRARSA